MVEESTRFDSSHVRKLVRVGRHSPLMNLSSASTAMAAKSSLCHLGPVLHQLSQCRISVLSWTTELAWVLVSWVGPLALSFSPPSPLERGLPKMLYRPWGRPEHWLPKVKIFLRAWVDA
ncbi:hypothetical protein GW17_00002973 [Ensete ventricosum]|nr:hypothetical protein GW17_00002973 [Ensete ventricosum]RZS04708.1 hypothetical protein BHM03_00035102 [Ensete ventricosum]